ncbi:MAG: RICIN domain-containing protein, partial [bacterium]
MAALAITAGCATEEALPAASTDESEIVTPLPEDIAIQVPGSNSCVDVANYSMSNGGPIHQWSCHFDANQLWRFTAVGGEGEAVYAITSRLSGLALDVTAVSTASGAPIQQ